MLLTTNQVTRVIRAALQGDLHPCMLASEWPLCRTIGSIERCEHHTAFAGVKPCSQITIHEYISRMMNSNYACRPSLTLCPVRWKGRSEYQLPLARSRLLILWQRWRPVSCALNQSTYYREGQRCQWSLDCTEPLRSVQSWLWDSPTKFVRLCTFQQPKCK